MSRLIWPRWVLGALIAVLLVSAAIYVFRPDSGDDDAANAGTATWAPIPGASLTATTGPGLTEPGIHVVAKPDSNGELEVVEQVRLAVPAGGVLLNVPLPLADRVSRLRPSITDFQAVADGATVPGSPTSTMPLLGYFLELPNPATAISMRYRLEGATERSSPAPPGRALVVLPPISASGLATLPVVVEVVGPGVRNVVCPDLPVQAQLCGRQHGQVWSTTSIPADKSWVVAQVDLPAPSAQ